jgi:hypothetical protein
VSIVESLRVTEISHGGAKVDLAVALAPESLHTFRLHLGEVPVVLSARIVYCRIGDIGDDGVTYRAGLEFTGVPAHVGTAIAEYIARLAAAREDGAPPG